MKNISPSNDKTGLLRNDSLSITGLVIAAGLSSRMGKFKPLMKYEGRTFLGNILHKLNLICDNIIVVTGHNANLIENEINSCPNNDIIKTVFNNNYKVGMFTSLQTGLKYSSNSDWVLYHFVDQPNLPQIFYEEFKAQVDNSFDWIQPCYNMKNGHPILINSRLTNKIIELPQSSNLKEITNQMAIKKKVWNCSYPEILNDIDTIESYNKLVK